MLLLFWRILTLEFDIPLIIGREALPSPVEEIPGKSFNISPIEYFLFFSMSCPSNNIFPLSPSYSEVGLIFDVIKTSGVTNIDSSLSAWELLEKIKIKEKMNKIFGIICKKKIKVNI